MVRPYLRNIAKIKEDACIASTGFYVCKPSKIITSDYLFYFMISDFTVTGINNFMKGDNSPSVSSENIYSFLLPLPPLEEQHLIVAKIEELFAQVDSIESDKTDLQAFIKHAKSKVLDLAIHGKLVPQDANDESATSLLEKIRQEKEAKIAAGEIKRDKNESFIYRKASDNCHFQYYEKFADGREICIDDEIPFEIPDGWCLRRLKSCCIEFVVPQRDKPKSFDGTIPWCRIEDIQGKYLNGSLSGQNVTEETIKNMNMHKCPVDSLIVACSASIGNQAIVKKECCTNQTFIGIVNNKKILNTEFLYYFFSGLKKKLTEIGTGTTIKYISRDKFENMIFPLPPLSEQKRIVSKIEEIFSALDTIASSLE